MELLMLAPDDYCQTGDTDPIAFYRFPLIGRLYRHRVARCVSLLPSGKRVLEIGYGSGVSFLNLGQKFGEIHGIDIHNHPGDVVASFARTGLRLHLKQGGILRLPYEDESFDAALAISVHEHLTVDQQQVAFGEVRRILRPGAAYVVGVPGFNFLMAAAFRVLGCRIREHHFSSETDVLAAMNRAFIVDRTMYSPSRWPKSLTSYVCIRGWKPRGADSQ
jgi:SAM-dependent methyltransferase